MLLDRLPRCKSDVTRQMSLTEKSDVTRHRNQMSLTEKSDVTSQRSLTEKAWDKL